MTLQRRNDDKLCGSVSANCLPDFIKLTTTKPGSVVLQKINILRLS